jgi:hypothetical protein
LSRLLRRLTDFTLSKFFRAAILMNMQHDFDRTSREPSRDEATIAISDFAQGRYTKDSPKSHFEGSDAELLQMIRDHFHEAKPGPRDGVCLVSVPPEGFFTPVVEVDQDTNLSAHFSARREGEDPFIEVTAAGEKSPALAVDIVLYRRDVLEADGEKVTGADWEIVSINARLSLEPEPMNPVTMARNFLELPGGTKTDYRPEDFAEAVIYWSRRVKVDPS